MIDEKFKDIIIEQCLNVLERKDVKKKFRDLMEPLIEMLLKDIYPYIFISIILVFMSFLIILGIFILLLRYKKMLQSIKKL